MAFGNSEMLSLSLWAKSYAVMVFKWNLLRRTFTECLLFLTILQNEISLWGNLIDQAVRIETGLNYMYGKSIPRPRQEWALEGEQIIRGIEFRQERMIWFGFGLNDKLREKTSVACVAGAWR